MAASLNSSIGISCRETIWLVSLEGDAVMPNGKELINEMDYQQRIKAMKPRELSEFTATQVYESHVTLKEHEKRLDNIEARLPLRPTKRKQFAFGGTIMTAIAAVFYALGKQLGWWA